MTWPAPDLRIDYSNADPQQDDHPLAHNLTNQTLNDDYRPKISANAAEIAAIREGFQGTPDDRLTIVSDGGISLQSDTTIQRRLTAGSFLGSVAVKVGNTFIANRTSPGFTTGTAYVSTVEVAPGIAPLIAGGFASMWVTVECQRNTADGNIHVQCGWSVDGVAEPTVPGINERMGASVRTGITSWIQNRYTIGLPAGAQPSFHCMVADSGVTNGVRLNRVSVAVDIYRY